MLDGMFCLDKGNNCAPLKDVFLKRREKQFLLLHIVHEK